MELLDTPFASMKIYLRPDGQRARLVVCTGPVEGQWVEFDPLGIRTLIGQLQEVLNKMMQAAKRN